MDLERSIKRYKDGDVVFSQGSRGDCMYVIRSGKVRIYRDQDGSETTLATLKPGESFGEIALFDDKPRSASAQCIGETEVLVVTRAEFESMTCDPMVRQVLTKMGQRIREIDEAFEKLSLEAEQRREFVSGISLRRNWLV
jgi:CRP/FNR family cyclic AMP-dependent transcriptional regulator